MEKRRTVHDILYNHLGVEYLVGETVILSINETGVEHAYFGWDEIEDMDIDIWDSVVDRQLVVRRDWGLLVYIEV